jgi:DNA-binding NarL/FixJ family response regulator
VIARRQPDVVLLDLDLGNGRDGMELVAPLSSLGIDVLVVSNGLDGVRAGEALSLGARRAVSKSTPLGEVVSTIERLARGLPVLTHGEAGRLLLAWSVRSASDRELRARLEALTHTEADILGHLMQGHQVGEIARIRVVSESTVRTHVKAILAKLQVKSQLTAVGLAYRLGWQPPGQTGDHKGMSSRSPRTIHPSGRAS